MPQSHAAQAPQGRGVRVRDALPMPRNPSPPRVRIKLKQHAGKPAAAVGASRRPSEGGTGDRPRGRGRAGRQRPRQHRRQGRGRHRSHRDRGRLNDGKNFHRTDRTEQHRRRLSGRRRHAEGRRRRAGAVAHHLLRQVHGDGARRRGGGAGGRRGRLPHRRLLRHRHLRHPQRARVDLPGHRRRRQGRATRGARHHRSRSRWPP